MFVWRGAFYQQAGEAQALGWLQIEMSVPVHDSEDGVKIFYRSRRRGEKPVTSYLADFVDGRGMAFATQREGLHKSWWFGSAGWAQP